MHSCQVMACICKPQAASSMQWLTGGLGACRLPVFERFAKNLLLLFLGRIETERPSDWVLRQLGKLTGQP